MAEKASNEMENLSLSRIPRDWLQSLTVGTADDGAPRRSDPGKDVGSGSGSGEEVELNLGLSLGGRFGVDKSNDNKLVRSSSVAAMLPVTRDDDVLGGGHENPGLGLGRTYSGLIRTSSLPVQTVEEWREKKEIQSMRRMVAKRRRSEKKILAAMGQVGSSSGPPFRSGKLPPKGARDSGGMTAVGGSGSGISKGGGGVSPRMLEFGRQGSGMTAVGGSSKGGGGVPPEGRMLELGRQGSIVTSGGVITASSFLQESSSSSKPPKAERKKESGSSSLSNSMDEMPCVYTQGDGPNGIGVDGILYKYGRGEQVKIMCVCHGSFFNPAEFVRHAGGTDFDNPLKHIVIKPGPSFT